MNTHRSVGTQLSPSLVHTWSRPAEALSWFCRNRGSQGGYTTAACRDQMYGTGTHKENESGSCLRELPLETATGAADEGVPFLGLKCQLLVLIPEEHRDVCGLNI